MGSRGGSKYGNPREQEKKEVALRVIDEAKSSADKVISKHIRLQYTKNKSKTGRRPGVSTDSDRAREVAPWVNDKTKSCAN